MEDIGVYAFSFENPERKKRLLERAKTIGIIRVVANNPQSNLHGLSYISFQR